jgi:hypothetical protein
LYVIGLDVYLLQIKICRYKTHDTADVHRAAYRKTFQIKCGDFNEILQFIRSYERSEPCAAPIKISEFVCPSVTTREQLNGFL